MLRPFTLSVLSLLFLGSTVWADGGAHSESLNARIVVSTEKARFGDLADRAVEEIRDLIRSEDGDWRVERSAWTGISDEAGSSGDDPAENILPPRADLWVWIGRRPPSFESADRGGRATSFVWLDPVGLGGPSPPGVTVVSEPFDGAVERDFAALRRLWTAGSEIENGSSGTWGIVVPVSPDSDSVEVGSRVERIGERSGISIRRVDVGAGGSEAADQRLLDSLNDADWVYFPPGSQWNMSRLAPRLSIPSFSGRGSSDVEDGVLAARADRRQHRLARLTALAVSDRIRRLPSAEEGAATGPGIEGVDRLAIHLGTAEKLGLQLPWRLRLDALTLGELEAQGSKLTLAVARRQAIDANLDLRARSLRATAGRQGVREAISVKRPQLTLSTEARALDSATAEASFGSQPERLVTATGRVDWILFSEQAQAAIDISRRLQASRELEIRQLELDVGLEAGRLLLAVARARAFEDIQKDHLGLTLDRLDEVRSRRARGAAGRADVARLEARAARDRRALVGAYEARRELEIGLNQWLARPLDGEIQPQIGEGAGGLANGLPLEKIVARPSALARLSEEIRAKARAAAPETVAAAEVTSAAERRLSAARRSFYLPTARFFGSWSERLVEDGAGTGPPPLPGASGAFPETPRDAWSFGLGLELPIYTGGARSSRRAEAELLLQEAKVLERRAERRVEERARLAMLGLETSYEAVFQARHAALAARRAVEEVQEAYSLGQESLTTWLDAQSELLTARREEAAATYGAWGRWLEVQRASGAFWDAAASPESTPRGTDWIDRNSTSEPKEETP